MSRKYVLGAKDMAEEDLLVETSIGDEILMKEKSFVELWNAVSEFHADLIPPISQVGCGSEPDTHEDDDLPLTEEERAFHAKFVAESSAQMTIGLAKEKMKDVNKFTRNAFLPIAPPRWIESKVKEKKDKIWEFETFNHSVPIGVNAYKLLASLSEEEVNLCQERALNENTEIIKGPYPWTADAMMLPKVGQFDPLKCNASSTTLAVRGFYPPKGQTALAELKRIWNAGRPYLKCRCVELEKGDCKTNITWFDQVLWYLLANPDLLFPEAPTLHARVRAMKSLLRKTWRTPVLASVVFFFMREIMVKMAHAVVHNPTVRQEKILDDEVLMLRKFPRKMAALILPDKYLNNLSKRRRPTMRDA
ncbi:hypothetical protein CBR_g44363 [Chara braunii]|uniref:Uncharacterized protein n=1 Tax=Chara braunii TaxID=69332 RepID=A0A388LX53_CHABU|nr:hypothetical protein CBR_g44363 [Chara braunii]|eukprot:GBG86907.1 hypothetical protein CBR_g44363 [Chara braunii]